MSEMVAKQEQDQASCSLEFQLVSLCVPVSSGFTYLWALPGVKADLTLGSNYVSGREVVPL